MSLFGQAVEANPLSSGLRSDYASFLLWDGRYAEAMENNDLVRKLGSTSFEHAAVWLNRSITDPKLRPRPVPHQQPAGSNANPRDNAGSTKTLQLLRLRLTSHYVM